MWACSLRCFHCRPPLLHHPLPIGLLREPEFFGSDGPLDGLVVVETPLARALVLPHDPEGDLLDGWEQDLDWRTIRKRMNRAIQRLREAERDPQRGRSGIAPGPRPARAAPTATRPGNCREIREFDLRLPANVRGKTWPRSSERRHETTIP